ncbi:MAG: type II toxin-antitoxin system RelE/ParE family toxin [Draconibacterium sp.]|jgi:plasmid stabilization system protein ParE|nr:type II toxin-antitoxin system RelE/ParE family toxin [Draconibacterium sp.]
MVSHSRVKWSSSARADIGNISDYLMNEWGKSVLTKFLLKLDRIIYQIIINPKQYPEINTRLKIRKYVVTKQNILFYKIKGETIEIVRLYDTRQDPNKLEILIITD